MLKLRDISLKKRILMTNFLMIALPVGFLLVLGGLLFAGLKTTGTIREAELALLWQDKREALSIQLAVSSLKAKADRGKKVSEMEADCRALERWGIDSLIAKNGEIVYASPGADPQELLQDVQILAGGSRSFLRWDERGLALLYRAEKTRTVVIARGLIPFHARAPKEEDPLHDVWEILAYIFLAAMAIVITALGRYLARLLSEQILSPLEKLKTAAEEIRRGNLDASPAIDSADEIGAVGRSFDFMRQALKEEKARREKYDENRKELIAGISHDLATPLTAIKGYASGILDGIAKSPEKERRYIEQIHESACLMENMVENLFLFSKLDLKKIPFHLESVALADYLADFARDRSDLFAVRGLALSFSSDGRPCRAAIDRTQFPRVLENFLENSIKYRRENVPAALHIHVEEARETVHLSFTDNGQGVPEEALGKLFDTFYRTDRARTDTSKGSGLGLAIAREIICACHGTIHAEANPAGGLILKITLPRQKETTEERRGDA